MEAQSTVKSIALGAPPLLLERIVVSCLPPAARETVAGDLYEMYRTPLQYGWQAASTLPLLVASQARRNANLPVLGLQSLVLFACFDGAFAMAHISHAYAVLAAAAGLLFLLIREAYQSQERPSCRRAILETIFLSGIVLLLFPQQLLLPSVHSAAVVWWPGFALLGFLMALIPVLCCLRAGLILETDRRHPPQQDDMRREAMPQEYRRFRQQTAWHNQVESIALLAAAIGLALLGGKIGLFAGIDGATGMGGAMVIGAYISAALYLLLDGSARALPPVTDLPSLRALYQYELARRHQLRRFLWWLWSAPLFLGLYTNLIMPGMAASHSTEGTLGILAALLVGFFVSALTREGAGPIQEKITLLGRLNLETAE